MKQSTFRSCSSFFLLLEKPTADCRILHACDLGEATTWAKPRSPCWKCTNLSQRNNEKFGQSLHTNLDGNNSVCSLLVCLWQNRWIHQHQRPPKMWEYPFQLRFGWCNSCDDGNIDTRSCWFPSNDLSGVCFQSWSQSGTPNFANWSGLAWIECAVEQKCREEFAWISTTLTFSRARFLWNYDCTLIHRWVRYWYVSLRDLWTTSFCIRYRYFFPSCFFW